MNKKLVAVTEMIFATMVWGFGFTATIWAIESYSPVAISVVRFGIAFILTLPLVALVPAFRKEFHLANFKLAFLPGMLLGLLLLFQTWGLQYTTATKCGFITTLYVVLVPIIEVFLNKKRLHKLHFLWVTLAIIGTALIVNLQFEGFNIGDFLTLICAFFAAYHIVVLGRVSPLIKSPFIFNAFQSLWAFAISALVALVFPGPHWKGFSMLGFWGMVSLTVGSTMIAFAMQVKAQRYLSPSISSLLFLLESPFAMFFGIVLLSENLTFMQIIGAMFIFMSAVGAVKYEVR